MQTKMWYTQNKFCDFPEFYLLLCNWSWRISRWDDRVPKRYQNVHKFVCVETIDNLMSPTEHASVPDQHEFCTRVRQHQQHSKTWPEATSTEKRLDCLEWHHRGERRHSTCTCPPSTLATSPNRYDKLAPGSHHEAWLRCWSSPYNAGNKVDDFQAIP